jgi:adenylate cyclase
MVDRLGIRGRLLAAFLGVSAFAVLASAAALYAFLQVGDVISEITERRVPATLTALTLSRQAERVSATAPAVLAVTGTAEHSQALRTVRLEMGNLEQLLHVLKRAALGTSAVDEIEAVVVRLRTNLRDLEAVVGKRLSIAARKEELLRSLAATTNGMERLVSPGLLVMRSKIPLWRMAARDSATTDEIRSKATSNLAEAIRAFLPQQQVQQEIASINNALIQIASAPKPGDVSLFEFPLRRSIVALEAAVPELDDKLKPRFGQRVAEFRALAEGSASIPTLRMDELAALKEGEDLIGRNGELSRRLTFAVNHLVQVANRSITGAGQEAAHVQRYGTGIVIGSAVLSILSSALIVWLYVDRNLLARLAALSQSMLAIAGGNLRTPVPQPSGDEIGRMAQALRLFRETAVEIEEKSLRDVAEARQRLVDAIETISEGFALYDAEDRLVLSNSRYREILYPGIADAVVPGAAFETILRRAVERGLVENAVGNEEEWIAGRLAAHRNPSTTLTQHRSNDRWIQINERRVTGGGSVAIYTDITAVKQHEAELESARDDAMAATQAKSRFLANMSHELRTPLNSVLGFSEMLSDGIYGALPERAQAALQKISTNGRHLLNLINDVLDLSKIEADQLRLSLRDYSIRQAVQSAMASLETQARSKGIALAFSCPDDLPTAFGDEQRVTQVLLNLLSNAVKFTDQGSVEVTVSLRTDTFEIRVRDTGPGIAAADKERIFEEFQQVDSSSTRLKGGTGLGLAITKRFVEMHGGQIHVESVVGGGSTFIVVLPIRAKAQSEGA